MLGTYPTECLSHVNKKTDADKEMLVSGVMGAKEQDKGRDREWWGMLIRGRSQKASLGTEREEGCLWRHLRGENTALAPSRARMQKSLGVQCLLFLSVEQSTAVVSFLAQVQQDKGTQMSHNFEEKREKQEHTTLDCAEQ